MRQTSALLLALTLSGCTPPPEPKKDGGGGGAEKSAPRIQKADVEGAHHVADLWGVCAADAVRWRDDFAGRRVMLTLAPPWEIKEDGGRFYTWQEYQNGARPTAARIYLRDDSARHLSKIIRREEKVPAWHVLRVRALIDERDFVFADGALSVVEVRP